MANKIILKKSSVATKVPVAGDLDFGELAINYTDSKLYFKKADGSIDSFVSSAGSSTVTSVGGNSGAVTDTQLLTSIKNVDGSESGLDADLLDGNHASAFYLASNPSGYTSNTGTVTSVGATAPIVSSGGTTPSLSIAAANSTTNGYMTSAYATKLDGIAAGATNVTNTNQLVNGAGYTTNTGTVTSVSALTLGTIGTDLSSTVANSSTTPVITLNIPTASAANRGALSAADWTTFNNKQPAGSYVTSAVTSFSAGTTGLTPSGTTTGDVTLAGTLATANGGTGLTSFTANGIPYASSTSTLTTGSALSFNGNNLLVGTTISPTGTGKISTSTGYTAPDNAAGAGTTLNILGSTGTGQASATGGNGGVQIIGGGGTSPWTNFGGGFGRRRGGILLQAGLAAADAGATYFNGSIINIFGSTATNNGTTTGLGSQIQITAGSAVSPTGTNGGGSVNLNASGGTTSGSVGINAGFAAATSANGGSASLNGGGSNTGTGGTLSLSGGSSSGGAGGPVNIQAGNSTGVAGANVSINSGYGTTPGKIGFTIGALGEVVQIGPTGAIGLSGANYGTAGQVLTSNGSSAVPTWTTVGGGSTATPDAFGTVYGYTDISNARVALGYFAGATNQASETVALGRSAGSNNQGSGSVAVGKDAGLSDQGNQSVAIGRNAGNSTQGVNSVAIGEDAGRFSQNQQAVAIGASAGSSQQGLGSIAIGYDSAGTFQGEGAVAIGKEAGRFSGATGQGQGVNSIAIGKAAGGTISLPYHQAANSIVLNATGLDYSAQNTGLYVKPIRTSVAAVGTQFSLVWDDSTGEISASAGAAPAGASWYSYVVGTGTDVTVPLPAGWDPAVFQGSGYLWTITSVNGSGYNPTPPYAWNNVGSPTWFWRVFQSNSGHPAPYPEFTDPTTFNFSSSPGIYTMLYISQIADSKTSLYTVYTPSSPNVYFGTYQYTAPGFPVFGSNQTGHSVIQMIGDFSNGSTYAVPSPTGTLDEVLYEPSSGMTIFFISHTSAQVSQISMGTPILVMNTTSSSGSLAFWYSYS